jgi:hypothetical protein
LRYHHRYFSSQMDAAGASAFHPRGEADEVEGLFEYVDTWLAGFWGSLGKALAKAPKLASEAAAAGAEAGAAVAVEKIPAVEVQAAAAPLPAAPSAPAPAPAPASASASAAAFGAPADEASLVGVPPLSACRVAVRFLPTGTPETGLLATADAAADAAVAADSKSADALGAGDQRLFTAADPFVARLSGARLLTAEGSDRRVIHVAFDLTVRAAPT